MSPPSRDAPAPSACPVCGCRDEGFAAYLETYHDPLGDKDYRIHRCGACGVVFADPFEHPGEAWYARFSPVDSYDVAGGWRYDWFLSRGFRPGGRLLDVGCGTGLFLERARDAGYRASGVESNPAAAAAAREKGFEVFVGGFADLARTAGEEYDVIAMFDVLEHFDDPAGMVERARRLLRPGGGLMITTPNASRPTPFGRDAFDFPPHHLTRWFPEVLERFLRGKGFEVVDAYHTYLPTAEYSRFLVARLQDKVLRLSKRLLYGSRRGEATLTQLIQEEGERREGLRGGVLDAVGDKAARTRMVGLFQGALGAALWPFFFPVRMYFRLTAPRAGVTSCVLAAKDERDAAARA